MLLLSSCFISDKQAEQIASSMSKKGAEFCEEAKLKSCIVKFLSKKKKEYKNVVIQSEDKGMMAQAACPMISKAFSNWLINGKKSEECGCKKDTNSKLLSEKIENSKLFP